MMERRRGVKFGRLALQAPPAAIQRFKAITDADYGHRGIKLLGAATLSLLVSMPRELRDALFDWGANAEFRPEIASDPDSAFDGFAAVLAQLIHRRSTGDGELSPEAERFIDRILDPAMLKALRERQRKAG